MTKKPEDRVNVMRWPVFMEDEGNHSSVMTCTREEAEKWIKNQAGEFYRPSDYYIAEIPKR